MKLCGLRWSKIRQENEQVALIPDSDQHLRRSRTDLCVILVAALCLLLLGLVVFFLLPRDIDVSYVEVKSADVSFDQDRRIVYLNITSSLDITNNNYYPLYLTNIRGQMMYAGEIIGKASTSYTTLIKPLGERQVDDIVPTMIADELSYMYDYCTSPTIREHTIGVVMQFIVTTIPYFGHLEQNFLETYQYVDCGGSTTTLHAHPEE